MPSKDCKHFANAFCFVCGQFVKTRARKHSVQVSIGMYEAYKAYLACQSGIKISHGHLAFSDYCKETLEGTKRKVFNAFSNLTIADIN